MHKITFLVIGLLLLSTGCVAIDEAGIDGPGPDAAANADNQAFGPASLAGMWKGESNWDGAVKEIFVMVRQPVLERMVTPTGQAPTPQSPIKSGNPASRQTDKVVSPTPTAPAPVWEPITDTGLVFWAWDIFFQISEKAPCNVQIIFKEDGPGKLTVVSQGGGTGSARFVQDGSERRIEVSLAHPVFKEIKGRFLYEGNKINGSFTLLGKEGVFKLVKEKLEPEEKQPK
jgi:hypothetical protein